jgi:magnesium transporter
VLRAFDRDVGNLVPCAPTTSAEWIHARDPSAEELEGIAAELGVSPRLLEHALDVDEVARVAEDANGVILVIVRVPWLQDAGKRQMPRSSAFGIAVGDKRVVTITRDDTDVLEPLVARASAGFDASLLFAVWVVHAAAERFLFHLRGIEERIDRLEAKIEAEFHNGVILELLDEQKNLVHLTTALRANKIMTERLGECAPKAAHASIADATIELRQAIEIAQVEHDMLAQTMSAFTSIVSNNLNDAMKFLTALTIVVTVPTIVGSLWGMNVSLPGDDLSTAFWYLLMLATGVSGLLALLFWRRGWL